MTLVTVTIIAHDAMESLPMALASVFAQTMEDWECIVVDDGSTDDTSRFLSSIDDPRVRSIRLTKNQGRGHARQLALDHARGRYVAPLDADDWMYPERLERQASALAEQPGKQVVTCSMAVVSPDGHVLGVQAPAAAKPLHRLAAPWISFAPTMVSRARATSIGFDRTLTHGEDVLFLTTLLLEDTPLVLDEPLYVYRPSSLSREAFLHAHERSRHAYAQHRDGFPFTARLLMARHAARRAIRSLLTPKASARLAEWSRRRRLQPLRGDQARKYTDARVAVVSAIPLSTSRSRQT